MRKLKLLKDVLLILIATPALAMASVATDDAKGPFLKTENLPHEVRLLEEGPADLEQRLQMIEHAEKSVDIETYIFEHDVVGKAILQALIKRVQELKAQGKNLEVRLMLDYASWEGHPGIDEVLAEKLSTLGIHVRYYNNYKKGPFWDPIRITYRDHRKVFVVDGNEVIVGGRNLSSDYFDLHPMWNFEDRDVWVKGAIAQAADQTFNDFWNSKYAVDPDPSNKDVTSAGAPEERDELIRKIQEDVREANSMLADDPQLTVKLAEIRKLGARQLASSFQTEAQSVSLISDRPGRFGNSHQIGDYFEQRLNQAKKKVLIENYTFLPTSGLADSIKQLLLKKKVKFELLTNGVDATGSEAQLWELSFPSQIDDVQKGMVVRDFNGKMPVGKVLAPGTYPNELFILHTKSMVVDDKDSWIGSNNIDPRSDNINSEVAIVVNDNPEFARAVENGTYRRMQSAHLVTDDGQYEDQVRLKNGTCAQRTIEATTPPAKNFEDMITHEWLRIRDKLFVSQF